MRSTNKQFEISKFLDQVLYYDSQLNIVGVDEQTKYLLINHKLGLFMCSLKAYPSKLVYIVNLVFRTGHCL